MQNRQIACITFATALFAGVAVPLVGAQASVVYSENFDNLGFRGSQFTAGLSADNNNDKYANPDITFYQAANFGGWIFSNANPNAAGPTFLNVDNTTNVDGAVLLNENAPGGTATKTVSGLTPNTQYQLSFLYYGDNRPGQIWGLHVDVNGSVLDLSDTDKAAGTNLGTIASLLFLSDGVGQALLSFAQTSVFPSEASPIFDNVQISTTTPLPATLPVFATGLGVLGLLGFRRKRKAAVAAA